MSAVANNTPDVLIIGAGISGCAAAYELAREGYKVHVLERYAPGAMASGWTLAGVRQSGRDPAELPLAQRAVRLWTTLSQRLEADTGYRQHGNLRLARNAAEVEVIRALVAAPANAGLGLRLLEDPADIRELAPCLSAQVLAASYCASDGHADPLATLAALRAAAERLGVRFSSGVRVSGITVTSGRVTGVQTEQDGPIAAGACIAAPGIYINELLQPLGLSIPLRVPMVTVVQTEPLAPLLAPVLGVANADLAARQQLDGRLRVTGGAETWHGALEHEQNGNTPRVAPGVASLGEVIAKVSAVLPAFAEARVARIWAGLLDLTPDALPVLDQVPGIEGLVVAAGFSGHGFGLGPVTGELLCDLVLDRKPGLALDAFRFDRFSAADEAAFANLSLHG